MIFGRDARDWSNDPDSGRGRGAYPPGEDCRDDFDDSFKFAVDFDLYGNATEDDDEETEHEHQ